jgi:putative transposase
MPSPSISYKRHRFPPQIIAPAVWLYVRFNLSLREVEEMLLKRGIDVSYVTVQVLDPLANRLGNVVPDP